MRTDVADWAGSEAGGGGRQHWTVSQTCVASGVVPFNGITGTDWDCDNTGQTGMVWLNESELSLAGNGEFLFLTELKNDM